MKQSIKYDGVKNMVGYGRLGDDRVSFRFPESISVARVIDFLKSATEAAPHVKLAQIEQCEPRETIDIRGNRYTAVAAKIIERWPDVENDSLYASALEEELNPAARPWTANYAGRIGADARTGIYVVTAGETAQLADFLSTRTDIQPLNPISALSNVHFGIRGADEEISAAATGLPMEYFRYITNFVAKTLQYKSF